MSNYVKGFVVSLKKEIPEETAENIAKAFSYIEGVVKIDPIEEKNCSDLIAKNQVRHKIRKELINLIDKI